MGTSSRLNMNFPVLRCSLALVLCGITNAYVYIIPAGHVLVQPPPQIPLSALNQLLSLPSHQHQHQHSGITAYQAAGTGCASKECVDCRADCNGCNSCPWCAFLASTCANGPFMFGGADVCEKCVYCAGGVGACKAQCEEGKTGDTCQQCNQDCT